MLTTQDLFTKSFEAQDIATLGSAVSPVRRRDWLVKHIDLPVAGGLYLQVRQYIHVDLMSLGHDAQIVGESKSAKVHDNSCVSQCEIPAGDAYLT